MSAKKYYAVKIGRKTGIFTSWKECKEQIIGFSGATYKGFETFDDAKNYLGISSKNMEEAKQNDTIFNNDNPETAIAYVDGSYSNKLKLFSAGVIIFWNGKTYSASKKYQDKALLPMRNIAGEIKAAELAMRFCLKNKIKSLKIFHDYEGIARWADGSWETTKRGTKQYSDFCCEVRKSMALKFVKVKGHSGDKYNDMADKLAKDAFLS